MRCAHRVVKLKLPESRFIINKEKVSWSREKCSVNVFPDIDISRKNPVIKNTIE